MSLYRFLSLLVSVLGAFIAAITLFSLFFALANPAALFQVFLFGCTVLYTWFANKFTFAALVWAARQPAGKYVNGHRKGPEESAS